MNPFEQVRHRIEKSYTTGSRNTGWTCLDSINMLRELGEAFETWCAGHHPASAPTTLAAWGAGAAEQRPPVAAIASAACGCERGPNGPTCILPKGHEGAHWSGIAATAMAERADNYERGRFAHKIIFNDSLMCCVVADTFDGVDAFDLEDQPYSAAVRTLGLWLINGATFDLVEAMKTLNGFEFHPEEPAVDEVTARRQAEIDAT